MYSKHRLRLGLNLLATLVLVLSTSACGYKGPLTMPPKTADANMATQDEHSAQHVTNLVGLLPAQPYS